MELLEPAYLFTVLLAFVRIGGIFIAAPIFGHNVMPVQVRVLLAVLLAYGFAGLIPGALPATFLHPVGFVMAVAIEAVTGLLLGFTAQLIFWIVEFAGEIIGFQMGLSLAHVYNPVDGSFSNPLGRFLTITLTLLFLAMDGHHHIVNAMALSFEVVPLGGANLAAAGLPMLDWIGYFFRTALQLAAPFMILVFLIDVCLGVFARVVPQANLFFLGLPLKLLVGLSMAYVFVLYFFPFVSMLIDQMLDDLLLLIEVLAS
ncbi:MAG: flagellar biosynthetic protein FliR [Bacteroidetes bacterium]|jgi:flagellar biosynthetic protein FliR|nr:flagellar biosynthetic protein FliR [Bacteroidota bacterium]